jgi:hypothetical protein
MTKKRRFIILSMIFILVVLIHFIAQFAVWAHLPGNFSKNVSSNIIYERGWNILSFPVFYVLPDNFVNTHFWVSMSGNSLLWSVLISSMVKILFFHEKLDRSRHSLSAR